jgi:rhodanese-related sulfurtransferase
VNILVSQVERGEVHIQPVSVEETWTRLKGDATSVLIDVRTIAEWAYVGLPELSTIGKRPVLVEWQGFPNDQPNTAFVERLSEALAPLGAGRDSELFFICRSGQRSLKAAQAMAAAGYTRCRNVAEGFEGPLDAHRHRGCLGGWKAKGLPWAQG